MSFSYTSIWEDTLRLIRNNASLLAALIGTFIFLPNLLMNHFLPMPRTATLEQFVPLMQDYVRTNWLWLLLANLVNMAGTLAMLRLLFGGRPTVGQAITQGFALLPFYFLASVISNIMIGMGGMLFVLPGFYLFGRMAVLAPVVAVEERRNPLDAIGRSFELTRGHGWAVIGLIVMVAVTVFVVTMVANIIFGSIFIILAGQQIGGMLALIVQSATSAAFSALMVILFAAIYRRLADGSALRAN